MDVESTEPLLSCGDGCRTDGHPCQWQNLVRPAGLLLPGPKRIELPPAERRVWMVTPLGLTVPVRRPTAPGAWLRR